MITTLKIDLSNKVTTTEQELPEKLTLEEKLGGFGKAVHDIEKHLQKYPDLKDAYDQRNLLCFNIGCFTGSNVMTSRRTIISGLSPLKTSKAGTNGIYYSAASGDLGPMIRGCNLDSINITGKSNNPIYLVLDNDKIYFEDAKELIGKTTDEKIRILADKYKDAAFAVIGPAAENLVRYANIAFSTSDQLRNKSKNMRFAGRGGLGAVMASKNLLGLVIKGDKKQEIDNVKELNMEIAKGKRTSKYKEMGTFFANIVGMEGLKVNVHNNFSYGSDKKTEQLFKENILKSYTITDKGCRGCAIKCWKEIGKDGKALGKLDFEPGMLLGPNLGIYNIEQILELINSADSYGIDAISAGVCIGYEMEQQKRFGDFSFAKELLEKISNGKHNLKEGVMRYSNNVPNAIHVKGIELAAYPGNLNPGYAFAIAGPHMSIDTYNGAWYPGAVNSVDEWVENIVRGPQIMLYDMNGLCKFAKLTFDQTAELYNKIFGEKVTADDLRKVTKTVNKRARLIDSRLGFTADDDVLPENCYKDLGSVIPHFNTKEFFEKVKAGVYKKYDEIKLD